LKQFRETAEQEAQFELADIEVAAQGLEDLLKETDPAKYAAKAYELMATHPTRPSMGAAVCGALLNKGEDGMRVANEVGKQVMRDEIGAYSPNAGAFIRGQVAINGFTKQFVNQTSPELDNFVKTSIEKIKEKRNVDEISKTGSPELQEATAIAVGKEMVTTLASPPLTKESQQFLKGLREAIEGDRDFATKYKKAHPEATEEDIRAAHLEIANVVVNNSTSLRTGVPLMTQDPLYKNGNPIWVQATKAAQLTFSKAQSETISPKPPNSDIGPNGQKKELTKEQIAENESFVRTQQSIFESRQEVLDFQQAVVKSPGVKDSVIDLPKGFKESAEQRQVTQAERLEAAKKMPKVQEAMAAKERAKTQEILGRNKRSAEKRLESAKPEMDQIAALEKDLDRLKKNPGTLDKFKAFFKGGGNIQKGLEKMQDETIKAIDKNKMEVFRKTDEEGSNRLQQQNKQSIDDLDMQAARLDPNSVHGTLHMKPMNDALLKFTGKEFSSENVKFLNEVADFKAQVEGGASMEELREAAKKISSHYVGDSAEEMINLKHDNLQGVTDATKKIDTLSREQLGAMFDGAGAEITALVQNDTLPRFQQSKEYQEGMKNLKDELGKEKMQSMKGDRAMLDQDRKGLAKNVSVRDALGKQEKTEAPKQKQKVGVK